VKTGGLNPGSPPSIDSFEVAAAYADCQATPDTADVDWSDEFDLIAEQTLSGSRG
jgi:hypothetical protein